MNGKGIVLNGKKKHNLLEIVNGLKINFFEESGLNKGTVEASEAVKAEKAIQDLKSLVPQQPISLRKRSTIDDSKESLISKTTLCDMIEIILTSLPQLEAFKTEDVPSNLSYFYYYVLNENIYPFRKIMEEMVQFLTILKKKWLNVEILDLD